MNASVAHTFWVGLWVWLLAVTTGAAFSPLVADSRFLLEGALGAAAVVLVGVVVRAAGGRRPVVVAAQAAVTLGWLTAAYGAGTGIAGVIPTPDTLERAGALAEATYLHAQRYAAPVPDTAALTATLAALVIVLALVIDVLAAELRWTPALGLVILAVVMVPATLLEGRSPLLVFVLGAAAYAGLLAVTRNDDGRAWGPRVTAVGSQPRDPVDSAVGHVRASIPAVGIAIGAIAVALVVPLVTPTAGESFLDGAGSGAGSGIGTGLDNPVLDMRRNLRGQSRDVLLTMTEEKDAPRPRYVRLASMQSVGDQGWTLGDRVGAGQQLDDDLPSVPGLNPGVPTTTARYRTAVSPGFETRWLPHVYAPTAVRLEDSSGVEINRSMLDISRLPRLGSFAGASYDVEVMVARPTQADLRTAPASTLTMSSYVDLPSSTPDVVNERAEEVTAGASNAFDRALALQRWFRQDGGFKYSLAQRPGSGMETIEAFLTDDRVGYCEQFATAMAMMARSLGIPSRVSVGFLSGEPARQKGTWVFRGTAMHAWPELYFAGVGWIGFEPTPGGSGYTPPTFAEGSADPQEAPDPSADPTALPTGAASPAPGSAEADAAGDAADGGGSWVPVALVVLGLLMVALAVPAAVRTARRRRRRAAHDDPAAAAEDAWAEVRDTATDHGIGWTEGVSPRTSIAPLRARLDDDPVAREAIDTLVDAVERSRYAPVYEPADLTAAVDHLVGATAAGVTRRQRLGAAVLPRSVLVPAERRVGVREEDEVLSLRE